MSGQKEMVTRSSMLPQSAVDSAKAVIARVTVDLAVLAGEKQAAQAVTIIVACCLKRTEIDEVEATIRLTQMCRLLQHYPVSVLDEITDPFRGIVGKCEFVPTVAELKKFADGILRRHCDELRRAKCLVEQIESRDKVWTIEDEIAFLDRAPRQLHLALQLALWTGQRQGDLLRLTWTAYDGATIKLKQSKTDARVVIPVGSPLKIALDATARISPVILVNLDGRPWSADGFRSSWRKACVAAGVIGVTFNDLRGTAVTRLALAGCTEAEIATVTGHTLRDVGSILDANYLYRDPDLAEAAIRKLESRTKTPDRAPDCA